MSRKLPQIIKDVGFDFRWDEKKVWQLDIPAEDMPIEELTWHFDVPFIWTKPAGFYDVNPRWVIEQPEQYPQEYERTINSDDSYPIDIMYWRGRWLILDGLHCLMKQYVESKKTVRVRKIPQEAIPKILKDQYILLICRQNVGRSQMAEGFMKARATDKPRIRVQSAGFEDIEFMKQKYGNRPHPQVIEVMKEKGIDTSYQHITQLSEELLKQATKIIVLANEDELPDFAKPFIAKMQFFPIDDPAKGTQKTIPNVDPLRLQQTRDIIEQIVAEVRI